MDTHLDTNLSREESLARRLRVAERGFEDAMAQRAELLTLLKALANPFTCMERIMQLLQEADDLIARCDREVPRA